MCRQKCTHRQQMQIKSENINAAKPKKRGATKDRGGLIKQREKDQTEQSDLNISDMRSTDFFALCPNKLLFKMEFLLILAPVSSAWTQTPRLDTTIPP